MRSMVTISSLIACTLSRVLKSLRRPSLVTPSCSFTPLLSRISIEAFSFSSFFRKAGIFMRSSGDWRYSPMACAADIVGAAMAVPINSGYCTAIVLQSRADRHVSASATRRRACAQAGLTASQMLLCKANIRHALCNSPRKRSPQLSAQLFSTSRASTAGREDCDVVIVGGGPAGLAFASALGAQPSRLKISNGSSIFIFS